MPKGISLFLWFSLADAMLSQFFVNIGGIGIETNRILITLYNAGIPLIPAKAILLVPAGIAWMILRRLSPRSAATVLAVGNTMLGIIILLELEVLILIWPF